MIMRKITVKRFTKFPITFFGEVAGECYGADTSDMQKNYERGLDCLNKNHGRVTEFGDVVVKIEGFSARVIRELYTHIIGTSRLQASTRYINYEDAYYFIPNSMYDSNYSLTIYESVMNDLYKGYAKLIAQKVPKQDAANVLPLGMTSTVMLKINARALIHLAHTRLCQRAYHEMRDLTMAILDAVSATDNEWKVFIDTYCVVKCDDLGYCPENVQDCLSVPKDLAKKYIKEMDVKLSAEGEKI